MVSPGVVVGIRVVARMSSGPLPTASTEFGPARLDTAEQLVHTIDPHLNPVTFDNHAASRQNVSSTAPWIGRVQRRPRTAQRSGLRQAMKQGENQRCSSRRRVTLALIFCLVPLLARAEEPGRLGFAPRLDDVAAAIANLDATSEAASFSLGDRQLPRGGHLQGIQVRYDAVKNRHLVFLTHDSQTVGYLLVVEFAENFRQPGRVIAYQAFPSDGQSPPLRHAGGSQLVDDVLAVGLEDNQQKARSEIQFWNVVNPEKPTQLQHLTLARAGAAKDRTSGAVGLVRRDNDYVLAAANWDSRAIDFYLAADLPLSHPDCRFKPIARWQANSAETSSWRPDSILGTYQAVNLLGDERDRLFLMGLDTTSSGVNVVDIFAVRLDRPPGQILEKLSRKVLELPRENQFRFAGGIWVDRDQLAILSSQRNLGAETWIGIARRHQGAKTPVGQRESGH